MVLPTITRGAILAACGTGAFQRGEQYAGERRVIHIEIDPEDGTIYSAVEGSDSDPYEQEINLAPGQRQARISGYCDCPVGFNCKHVAAALLTLMRQQERSDLPISSNSFALADWQRRFSALGRPSAPPSQPRDQRVIYLLGEDDERALEVTMQRVRRRKSGSWGKPQPIPGSHWYVDENDYLAPDDLAIVELLRSGADRSGWHFSLEGRIGAMALAEIIASGRACLPDGKQASAGDKRRLIFSWEERGAQTQLRVALAGADGDWLLSATEPTHYLDLETGLCGKIDSPLTAEQIQLLREMPPVQQAARLDIAQLLAEQLPQDTLPLPVDNLATAGGEPIPLLRLARHEPLEHLYAALYFLYGEHEIRPFPPRATQVLETSAGQLLLTRAEDFERDAVDKLEELGFTGYRLSAGDAGDVGFLLDDTEQLPSPLRWAEFLDSEAEQLRQRGWRIERDSSFQLDVVTADSLSGELHGDSLGIRVNMGDQYLDLLPLLVQALEYGGQLPESGLMVETAPDHWLKIPRAWIEPVLNTLIELHEEPQLDDAGRLKLHHHNLAPLAQLEDELGESQFQWSGGEERRALARQLKNLQSIEAVAPPQGLRAELRDYQKEGLNWLAFLHQFRFGGILADDMGLGKTLQTLAFILHLKERGELAKAALIVAPTSLLGNWLHEAEKFAPGLRAVVSHGTDRKPILRKLADDDRDWDLVITSYALAQRDADILAPHPFSLLVLDEAQAIKNPRAKVSRALRAYQAAQRLCLTGTPLENHLGEFWAQFDFLMPGLLGNDKAFNRLYRKPIEKQGDAPRQQQLRNRTAPFMLRRTKEQVASELPPKTEIVQTVTLGDKQRKLYQTVRASMEKEVRKLLQDKGLAKSHIQVLDALLKLRQICCDPGLVKLPSAAKVKESAKLEALLEMLEEMLAEGRKILLFSQFTSMLSLIEGELQKRGIAHSKLTGRTRKRQEAIDDFQSGRVPLFLISLKAGGFGLNLTAADTVIHYDPWWNPAAENQATDRAHRIGQQKAVFVYKLIAEGTIEERIQALQSHKQSLADALLTGEGAALTQLSGEEILQLFS